MLDSHPNLAVNQTPFVSLAAGSYDVSSSLTNRQSGNVVKLEDLLDGIIHQLLRECPCTNCNFFQFPHVVDIDTTLIFFINTTSTGVHVWENHIL